MNEKREALMNIMDQLAKLLPLLSSDKSGEAAAAAGRATYILAKAKLDWHDLVKILQEQPSSFRTNSWSVESDQETLIRLASEASFFSNSSRVVFADISVNGHRETLPIAGPQFSEWLIHAFWKEKTRIPTGAQIRSMVQLLRARALYSDNQRHEVHLRVAEHQDNIYWDIGDDSWRAVEISAQGWQIIDTPPVRFRRTPGMLSLPVPVRGGKIDELRPFTNLSDDDFVLVVGFALDTLRVGRPHPVLYFAGDGGSTKSTHAEILARLCDPHSVKLRKLPGVRDLFVASGNKSLLCFDNVSAIPAGVSDALCQISSGSGYANRKNYTDSEEFQVAGCHPIVLTGIENCINRADLADRALIVTLPPLDPARRKTESEFWAAFEAAHPQILGAMLDIAVHGLANRTSVKTSNLARVADFQRWVMACETAFCAPGTFERAFASNRAEAVETLIDDDPVAKAIGSFMVGRTAWEGTVTQLLSALAKYDQTEARVTRSSNWPRDAARLSKAIRANKAILAKAGITIQFDKATDRRRTRSVSLSCRGEGKAQDSSGRSPDGNPRITSAQARRSALARRGTKS